MRRIWGGNRNLWKIFDFSNRRGAEAQRKDVRRIWSLWLVLVCLLWSEVATAAPLSERLASFPNWENKPLVQVAEGDLVYPDWMVGTWNVTSTLVDMVAPLAPDIVTPGFEGNRQYLERPVTFQVRFVKNTSSVPLLKLVPQLAKVQSKVVADRAFNGLNLAKAYLGDHTVIAVKVDPDSPNRQITLLRGDRQLISLVTGRATETPEPGKFMTTELFQQLFAGGSVPYFNTVESTTGYRQMSAINPSIEADQVTAIYLSPQDPNYFTANQRPVALYRYRLQFFSIAPDYSN